MRLAPTEVMRCSLVTSVLVVAAACSARARVARTAGTMPTDIDIAPPSPVLVVGASHPDTEPEPEPAIDTRPVRWLPGFAAIASSDAHSDRADDRLGPPPPDCQSGDTETRTVIADVSAEPGIETIVASLGHGVVVFAADGHELARAPIGCGGSADELGAVAVGTADAIGPVVAVLATTGGRAEATTHVDLFRIESDEDGATRVQPLFSAPIETRDGDQIRTGRLEVVAGGLVFRRPAGRTTMWTYDPGTRTMVRSRQVSIGPR